jgi:two-component system, NarL family, sensor kinase
VEVAAYRIGMEALTKAARHTDARHCRLRLTLDHTLDIEVTDDGIGPPTERGAGVGLAAMRERAAELGGTLHHRRHTRGGNATQASLVASTTRSRS